MMFSLDKQLIHDVAEFRRRLTIHRRGSRSSEPPTDPAHNMLFWYFLHFLEKATIHQEDAPITSSEIFFPNALVGRCRMILNLPNKRIAFLLHDCWNGSREDPPDAFRCMLPADWTHSPYLWKDLVPREGTVFECYTTEEKTTYWTYQHKVTDPSSEIVVDKDTRITMGLRYVGPDTDAYATQFVELLESLCAEVE